MTAASLAGFSLVFALIAWSLSTMGGLALLGNRDRLRRLGLLVERRAATFAAVVPIVLASAAVTALIVQSIVGPDHCEVHGHHAHLCLVHGAVWLDRAWVMVALASIGAVVAARSVFLAMNLVRSYRSVAVLRAVSVANGPIRLVESQRAFCFVAGLVHPAIYVSTRVWSYLSPDERVALIAHEAAHVRQRDLHRRVLVEAFLALAAPLVGQILRTAWLSATERLCDARAVGETGDAASVASAMVAMCRLNTSQPASLLGFSPPTNELAERVRAVLAGAPLGAVAAGRLARVVVGTSCGVVLATACAAEPLHHALETLLG